MILVIPLTLSLNFASSLCGEETVLINWKGKKQPGALKAFCMVFYVSVK